MKLFHNTHYNDFGDEWYFYLLKGKHRAFLCVHLSYDDYPGEPGVSFQLNPTNGLRFELSFGRIVLSKSLLGKHFD